MFSFILSQDLFHFIAHETTPLEPSSAVIYWRLWSAYRVTQGDISVVVLQRSKSTDIRRRQERFSRRNIDEP